MNKGEGVSATLIFPPELVYKGSAVTLEKKYFLEGKTLESYTPSGHLLHYKSMV